MHLPYIQVTRETWELADQFAALAGIGGGDAFRALCDLWRWGLCLGDENLPPTGVCESRIAAKRMAAAMHWTGDPDALAATLVELGLVCQIQTPSGEATGLRVRGMSRYHGTWRRNRAGPGRPPSGDRAEPKKQTQTQTQTQNKEQPPSEVGAAPTPPPFKLVGEAAEKTRKRSEAQEFWDWAEGERVRVTGRVRGPEPGPVKLNAWFKRTLVECGDVDRLQSAWARYILHPLDDHWRTRGFPFAGFMSDHVWTQYAPPKEAAG